MLMELSVDDDRQEAELRSLHDWLRQDPAGRRAAPQLKDRPASPGSLGSVVDVLQLVTGNGWSAASFVLSVVAWRQTGPRPPRLTIRRGDLEVILAEGTDVEVERVIRLLEAGSDQDSQP